MVAVNIELERNEHKGLGKRLQPQDSLFKWINMVFVLFSKIIFEYLLKWSSSCFHRHLHNVTTPLLLLQGGG